MIPLPTLTWIAALVGLAFVFAFGAIVGSFLNVVIYRLPLGQGLVRPASACPACGTPLRWTDNFPIFGWILLRARCRYCKSPISPQYVLIELLVAALFAGTYALWFMEPTFFPRAWVGVMAPEWTVLGLRLMWPVFFLILSLVAALIAITIIDARTYLIPLIIPTSITIAAFLVHPLNALMVQSSRHIVGPPRMPSDWTILLPSAAQLGASIGAMAGLLLSGVLVWRGLMSRSFSDYEQWEAEASARPEQAPQQPTNPAAPAGPSARDLLLRTFLLTGPAIALMAVGVVVGGRLNQPMMGIGLGTVIGLLIGWLLRRLVVGRQATDEPMWLQYPHARREMLREILFLTPCVLLGVIGFALSRDSGPLGPAAADAPLWLRALGGSLMGYLVGGGVVWGVRIFGTLAFGKEAMGLGDVHLMAMVGAVLGWADPFLAFFLAPFLGILWTAASVVLGRLTRRSGTALPFGPHLAVATLLVLYGKPAFEWGLGWLLGNPDLNLP